MNPPPHITQAPPQLRFPCPCCGNLLTLPSHLANVRGPCPKCGQDIISPDPLQQLPARACNDTTPPTPSPPDRAGVPPPPSPPIPKQIATTSPPPSPSSSCNPIWRWAACTTPVLTFIAGLFVGRSTLSPLTLKPSRSPRTIAYSPSTPSTIPPSAATTETTGLSAQDLPGSAPLTPPPTAPPLLRPDTDLASLSAEQVLHRFVKAPTWRDRLPYIAETDNAEAILKAYADQRGDGPIDVESILFIENTEKFDRFNVITQRFPEGFPVVVFLTPKGPRVDWDTFVGFHDDLFREFADGPIQRVGAFDVYLKPTPQTPVEQAGFFERYTLSVPMPGRERQAFVKKDSDAHTQILSLLKDESHFPPATRDALLAAQGLPLVLEIAKLENTNGPYLQITSVIARGWGSAP